MGAVDAAAGPKLDAIDLAIVDRLQDGLPLVSRPFSAVAAALGLTEAQTVERLGRLLEVGALSRFGPMYNAERMGGAFTLAALSVPPERFDEVAARVNALPEVAHNYRREHHYNMWFVVATERAEQVPHVLAEIERLTGIAPLDLPKLDEYFLRLRLPIGDTAAELSRTTDALMGGAGEAPNRPSRASELDATDRRLVLATQAGLPIAPDPFAQLASRVELSEQEVVDRFARMLRTGVVRRIAAVPNHYTLGFRANGMSVWAVDDDAIAALGPAVGALPCVSHCYRRPRRLPDWPYNLFAMVHGRSRDDVMGGVWRVAAVLGGACRKHEVLFSTQVLKKTGMRIG